MRKGHSYHVWLAAYNNASSPIMADKAVAEIFD